MWWWWSGLFGKESDLGDCSKEVLVVQFKGEIWSSRVGIKNTG